MESFVKQENANKASSKFICLLLVLGVVFSFYNSFSCVGQTLDPYAMKAPAPANNPAIEAQASVKFISRSYKNPHIPKPGGGNEDTPSQWAAIFAQDRTLGFRSFFVIDVSNTRPNVFSWPLRDSYPRAPPTLLA